MDNQFINAPLLVNRSAPYLDPKDELIRGLQLKNVKLKTELMKIQTAMKQKFQSLQQDETPKKRQSIFQSEENFEVLTKELANTYKRIKMYEYEVSKLQGAGKSLNVSQKASQVDQQIKQKRIMAEKLRQQYLKEHKSVLQNNKRLENNNQRDEIDLELKKLTDQGKFYKEKVRFYEQKETIKIGNMKRQYEALKKLQKQLVEAGVTGEELEQMKQHAIKGIAGNKKQANESRNLAKDQTNSFAFEQQIEDRTKQHYLSLMSDIALLQKMQNDHQKQLVQAENERQQAMKKNMNSRNKLLECENEIQNLEKQISIMKNKVLPNNMKPLKPIRSFSSQQAEHTQKLVSSKSSASKSKNLAHLLKFDQVGLPGKGQRFTDRNILGKTNLNSKIIRVKVYLDKNTNLVAGISCTYMGNKKGGDYIKKDRQAHQNQYNQQELICKDNSFVRSVSGTLDQDDRLESLSFTTSNGTSHKFGNGKTTKKYFNLEISSSQYPVCVYGCLLAIKQPGKKQYSLLQHLGFEIQSQNMNSSSADVNQFND